MSLKKTLALMLLISLLLFAISFAAAPLRILRIVSGMFMIGLIPGIAAYLLIRRPAGELLEAMTISMALSPVVVTVIVWLLLFLGVNWAYSIGITVVASIAVILLFIRKGVTVSLKGTRREALILVLILILLAIVASAFHISSSYYRMRGDAWHQAEMAYEIMARGVPPLEPTYHGQTPQYYWLYQLYVVILCKISTLGPFDAMSIVSAQFLFLAGMSFYLLSRLFKDRFSQNISAVVLTILGGSSFGYLMWIAKSMVGSNRGWTELAANVGKINDGVLGTTAFVNIAGGVAWIVAKYMHSNPMVIGSVLFFLGVYFLLKYLSERSVSWLMLLLVALIGVLLFHTISGIVFMIICGPAIVLLYFIKRKSGELSAVRDILPIIGVFMLALLVTSPYLIEILGGRVEMQSIQRGNVGAAMIANPILRLAAIVGSSLLFMLLAVPACVSLIRNGSAKNVFFLLMIACLLLYGLFGPGTYNVMRKFYFYSLVFLSIMGSWAIPGILKRFWTSAASKLIVVLLLMIVFLPTPAVLIYGWITDPELCTGQRELALMVEKDKQVYRWMRQDTPIDAVFADSGDRTFILVFGERRTYQYVSDFTLAWRQDQREKENRERVLEGLYSPEDLEPSVRERLQSIEVPFYVLVRKEDFQEYPLILEKMDRASRVFERVYGDEECTVYRVVES